MLSQTSSLIDLYTEVRKVWQHTYELVPSVERDTREAEIPFESSADTALVLKHIVAKLEDMRAECNKALSTIEKVACLQYTMVGRTGPIRGEIATATPRPGSEPPSLKRKDNAELYDTVMMGAFGFSKESCENELARLHWPNVEAYMAKLMAEGRPLPPALKGMQLKPTFKLTCRCASGVDLDELANARESEKPHVNGPPTAGDQPADGKSEIPF